MHTKVFNLNKNTNAVLAVDASFSFRVFIDDLKRRAGNEHNLRSEFYSLVLDKFNSIPELTQPIDVLDTEKYQRALEWIYLVVSPPISDENEYYWALGSPVPGKIIFCTEAFFQFITGYHANKNSIVNQDENSFIKRQEAFVYQMILEKLYNISSDLKNDIIYTQPDEKRGLEKYYKIHLDTSFITITANEPLPQLNPVLIEHFLHETEGCEILRPVLPLSMVSIEGFCITTVEDVTAEQSIQNIRLALVNHSSSQAELFERVTFSLQTLTGHSSIQFGLLPFLKVNGKVVLDSEECFNSVLINSGEAQNIPADIYNAMIEEFIKNPKAVFFNEITEQQENELLYLKLLKESGIKSYAVLPVYYNQKLAGIIEVYSKKGVIHYEKLLSKLEDAVPLISQLLHNSIEQFNTRIDDVIKEHFTTLQQSVEWKFNEAAWKYIKDNRSEDADKPEIKTVSFKDVYPLYGAIDIRNSTAERNMALQHDLGSLLTKLAHTLGQLAQFGGESHKHLLVKCEQWLTRIKKQITDNDDVSIKTFLESDVYPLFKTLKENFPAAQPIIDEYYTIADELTGDAYASRRKLEESMTLINRSLNNYFERSHQTLQNIYPCYFETFRTDGVEYDIYTGQSLHPDRVFDHAKLNEFRRWQLKSMIDIVRITHKLLKRMPCKLATTQLIFVHSNPIDISFRKDERRFDVEGAYNIRYEVIKKRIDKVLILGTEERLTQPGKIALVYSSKQEAHEFMTYIQEFQQSGALHQDIEHLDLEELQGVTGLRAVRLTVNID